MKNRDELRKAIKDLKQTLEGYEMQIQKYRKHIELLMQAARKTDSKTASQTLPTSEADGKTAPSPPETHETVASFIAKLTTQTRINQIGVKKASKPSKGTKNSTMNSKKKVQSGIHGISSVVKIE